ncbi:recQ-mediated genome instability protein 2 [Lampris incognitus]|uniref:recQ-mediated genome instability protein 2 n=1 Tax=Lampris incognitus TaxID=2546036 RepID=UPI0024B51665|nr:recQ-mediated genome instability protein 2 [Lampris incognitus]
MDKTETPAGIKRPPPIKLLSAQLREGDRKEAEGNVECFIRGSNGRILPVSMVWMQGTILEVKADRNAVRLSDETGTFVVQGIANIPKGKPCLSDGKYVMVMGVIKAISPEPVIHAVKMADLSQDAAIHKRMWKLEVEDLQQVLS